MLNEPVFIEFVKVECLNVLALLVLLKLLNGSTNEKNRDLKVDVEGCSDCLDSFFFGDSSAVVRENVMVCEGVENGTWRSDYKMGKSAIIHVLFGTAR